MALVYVLNLLDRRTASHVNCIISTDSFVVSMKSSSIRHFHGRSTRLCIQLWPHVYIRISSLSTYSVERLSRAFPAL